MYSGPCGRRASLLLCLLHKVLLLCGQTWRRRDRRLIGKGAPKLLLGLLNDFTSLKGFWFDRCVAPEFSRGPFVPWETSVLGRGHRSWSHSPVETGLGADRRTTESRHYRQETGVRWQPLKLHALSSAMEPSTDSRKKYMFYSVSLVSCYHCCCPSDHGPMSSTPLILLLQQQLVHNLQEGKVCCVARNAFQQSWDKGCRWSPDWLAYKKALWRG